MYILNINKKNSLLYKEYFLYENLKKQYNNKNIKIIDFKIQQMTINLNILINNIGLEYLIKYA